MKKFILVCGPTGAGKTTYSLKLASEIEAVKFFHRSMDANDVCQGYD